MAKKLEENLPLFLGEKVTREATVFGQIRLAVSQLDQGEGVLFADLTKYMLENFKPNKSGNYDASYIRSYVRDAVHKFGYLSQENGGVAYAVEQPKEKAPKEPKADKKPTKADSDKADLLAFIATRGEVASADEVDSSQITVGTIVQETKKKVKTVEKLVKALEEGELVRTELRGEEVYVFLTVAGFESIPAPAAPAEGEEV